MNTMGIGAFLLSREIVSSAGARMRQLGLMQAILAVVLVLLMVPASYRYLRVGGIESAEYDYSVSGDLSSGDVESLADSGPHTVTAASVWALQAVADDVSAQCDVYFVDDMESASRMLPLNETLLCEGGFGGEGVVVSADVARRLRLAVGDHISFKWDGYAERTHELRLRVDGVTYSSASGSVVIAPEQSARAILDRVRADLRDQGQSAPDYTVAYVGRSGPVIADGAEAEELLGDGIVLETKDARLAAEEGEVQRLQGGQMRIVLVAAVALYLFLLLQHMNHRLTQNGKLYAILAAMGGGPKVQRTHFLLDSVATVLLLSLVGLGVSTVFYRSGMHMYMPLREVARVAIPAVASNLLVAAVLGAVGIGRFSRDSLATVLSGE